MFIAKAEWAKRQVKEKIAITLLAERERCAKLAETMDHWSHDFGPPPKGGEGRLSSFAA
jgi:hypothetical protein